MKTNILIAAFLLSFVSPLSAQTNPKTQAADMFERFLTAMTAADNEAVVSLFSADALFWGTGSESLVTETNGVSDYFAAVGQNEPGQTLCRALHYEVIILSDEVSLLSGMWEVVPPNQAAIPLRLSLVVAKRDGELKIIQFHNSSVPE